MQIKQKNKIFFQTYPIKKTEETLAYKFLQKQEPDSIHFLKNIKLKRRNAKKTNQEKNSIKDKFYDYILYKVIMPPTIEICTPLFYLACRQLLPKGAKYKNIKYEKVKKILYDCWGNRPYAEEPYDDTAPALSSLERTKRIESIRKEGTIKNKKRE